MEEKVEEIPKTIHYCWFGGSPLPELAQKCIASWRKYLPDYKIIRWDESNFDIDAIPYTKEAYAAKKYAFVSDYARFLILYKYGGLYFDTDVEVISPIKGIIKSGPFLGIEKRTKDGEITIGVAPGLGLGAVPGMELYKDFLEIYQSLNFKNSAGDNNFKTVVEYTTELLEKHGFEHKDEIQRLKGATIYPSDYFCPIDYDTKELKITDNTVSIHHYAESWLPLKAKIYNFVKNVVGVKTAKRMTRMYKRILRK